MANVHVYVCTTTPNLTTSTYGSWCPVANRRSIIVDDVELAAANLEVSVKPEPIDSTRVSDMTTLIGVLLVAWAVLWGLKQIYRIFSGDMERD